MLGEEIILKRQQKFLHCVLPKHFLLLKINDNNIKINYPQKIINKITSGNTLINFATVVASVSLIICLSALICWNRQYRKSCRGLSENSNILKVNKECAKLLRKMRKLGNQVFISLYLTAQL